MFYSFVFRGRLRFIMFVFALFIFNYLFISFLNNTFTIEVRNNSGSIERETHKDLVADPIRVEIDPVTNNPYKCDRNGCHEIKVMRTKVKLKYILLWTRVGELTLLKKGQVSFIENKCKFTNCYITSNRHHLLDMSEFDAILFSRADAVFSNPTGPGLPSRRYLKQKYVFVSTEPATKYLVLQFGFDDFFNWTWTYRVDSDFMWNYIKVYNKKGEEIAPALEVDWPDEFDPISEELKKKLSSKSKAAAWFGSNCNKYRRKFVEEVNSELNKYGWSVDEYGKCGKKCGSFKNDSDCFEMLQRDYYFYFAFEDAVADDYVTGELLNAVKSLAVPIVYGGADYARFIPYGSFLDARAYGAKRIAKKMNKLIRNITLYHDFFRWINHYRLSSTRETKDLCNICTALNDGGMMRQSTYRDFRNWWNRGRWTQMYDSLLNTLRKEKRTADLVMSIIDYVS